MMTESKKVSPVQVMEGFRSGKSTADMAKEMQVSEASVYKLLVIAREAQRLFHDPACPLSPALHESAVAKYKRWQRLSFPEIHAMEDARDLADSSPSKRQKDRRPVQADDGSCQAGQKKA